ncbi:PREDICTED: WAP four-disulfide core domain protein 2-like [Nicrophorus vespilloides]|uniref:WAP four-disulfide core domain protein 2-like n=1 Tax=Nicrophorus vespilloides TaxID=110193 RepID=A0ABM1NFM2_NICVS|nr:PREDICTED: WAP four-disulfide core domain protein 2-like [Nicrophorus vespilloides]
MFVKECFVVLVICGAVLAQRTSHRKPGDCPPPVGSGICAYTCSTDSQCDGATKCCRTACGGTICTMPVTARQPKLLSEKKGSCPARPTGPWVCSSRCAFDGDCRGSKKCCKNRCGAMACTKPE